MGKRLSCADRRHGRSRSAPRTASRRTQRIIHFSQRPSRSPNLSGHAQTCKAISTRRSIDANTTKPSVAHPPPFAAQRAGRD
ncbi:hypothetical protein CA831_32470, partial [Burkholderia multivorans]